MAALAYINHMNEPVIEPILFNRCLHMFFGLPAHVAEGHSTTVFECSGYVYAREHFQDLFQSHITTVSQFVSQPQCNRLAKFLRWIRACRMNKA